MVLVKLVKFIIIIIGCKFLFPVLIAHFVVFSQVKVIKNVQVLKIFIILQENDIKAASKCIMNIFFISFSA